MAAYLERVNLLFSMGRYADAERALRDALADDPDDALAHAMLGVALRQLGGVKAALEESENAIRLDPTSSYVFYARSLVLIRANRSPEALEAVREAIRLDSDCDPDYFMILGALLFDKQEWNGCLAALDRALSLDPQHVTCLNLRGRALLRVGRESEAEQALETALAAAPNHAESHHTRGVLLLHRAEGAAALDYLLEARRLDPLAKRTSNSIALAVGRQMIPFRWISPRLLYWYSWRPKVSCLIFPALIFVYAGLTAYVHPPRGSALPVGEDNHFAAPLFGGITASMLFIPLTFDALAALAALVAKPRFVGTKILMVFRQVLLLALFAFLHSVALVAGLLPPFMVLLLSGCACHDFIKHWYYDVRKRWWTNIALTAYAGPLAVLVFAMMMFIFYRPTECMIAVVIFALLGLFSDNVLCWAQRREA